MEQKEQAKKETVKPNGASTSAGTMALPSSKPKKNIWRDSIVPFFESFTKGTMFTYVLQRIFLVFVTAFIILSLTYIMLRSLPVNPGTSIYAEQLKFWTSQVQLGYYRELTDEIDVAWYKANDPKTLVTIGGSATGWHYYVPYPIMVQYGHWLSNIFTKWDWGTSTSLSIGKSAMVIEMTNLPATIKLNVISIFISIPAGIGLGIWAALKKNKAADNIISTIIMISISVPSFVLISFLLIWFSYDLGWLPSSWPDKSGAAADPGLAARAYVIPVASLSFGSIAGFARYTRAELTEVMSSEFLLLARTKGLTKPQTVVRHALRNSMVPIVPMIIGQFVGILSGSMILEQLYRIPGVGRLFVDALSSSDYPVVMVDMAVYTLIGLFATLLVDLSYGIVDPRIRMGAVK